MSITEELLIGRGFFPEFLPPPFNSNQLATETGVIIADIDNVYDLRDKRGYTKFSKSLPYSVPKIGTARRVFSIVNPLHEIRLANTIVANWNDIISHTENSKLSLSRLNINTAPKGKSFLEVDFHNRDKERILRSSNCQYLLQLDIARFYHSIYTHSIPWALHTKEKSKKLRKRADFFGNAIDEDIRRMQDGQTIGIPIGQDTSRVVSEIIAVALEQEVGELQGIRMIDDFYLYFSTYSELEKTLAQIQRVLGAYELGLNHSKQKIIKLPEVIENSWVYELRGFVFRSEPNPKLQLNDLLHFFDMIILFSKQFPDDYVVRYAVAILKKVDIQAANWEIFEELLLKLFAFETKTIDYIADIFLDYRNRSYPLNLNKISSALKSILRQNLILGNTFEVAWIIWLLSKLEIQIDQATADEISKSTHPVVALIALDLNDMGGIKGTLDVSSWKPLLRKEDLYTENWLLAYESVKKGWLTPVTDYIAHDPFYEHLRRRNIEFYDAALGIDVNKHRNVYELPEDNED